MAEMQLAVQPTQVIPSTDLPELPAALVKAGEINLRVEVLFEKAMAFGTPKSEEDYAAIGAVLSEARSIRKGEVAPLFAPFNNVWQKVRDFLKTEEQKLSNRCEQIDYVCKEKMKHWEQREVIAAAKEQHKVQREQPGATVAPNIPSVAGYRRSTVYKCVLKGETPDEKRKSEDLILAAFIKGDKERRRFLRQFICVDEQTLAKYAREQKNPTKVEKDIPAVHCWQE